MATKPQDTNLIILNTLSDFLNGRVGEMKAILEKNNITEQNSALNQSIEVVDTVVRGNNYSASVTMEDYYEFIDQGVKGIGKMPHDGPMRKATGKFQFKTPFVNRRMVNSIRDWGARKPRGGVTKANMDTVAYLTAKKVKRLGIRQTLFFTTATAPKKVAELEQALAENIGNNYEVIMMQE